MIPFFFLNISRGDLERIIGDHVSVLSSDAASIVSAIGCEKSICIEDLDLAPSDVVDDIVRLLTSDRTVVATASEDLLRSVEGGLPDQATTLPLSLPAESDIFKQMKSGLETGIQRMVSSVDQKFVPIVASVVFFSESGAYNVSLMGFGHGLGDRQAAILGDKRAAILDGLGSERPRYAHTFYDVLDQCLVDLKTYYGPEEGLPALEKALAARLGEARRKDEEIASTPLEVSKRERMHSFRDWFFDEMGLPRNETPNFKELKVGTEEMMTAFKAVYEHFKSLKGGDSIPPNEVAMEALRPLIAAYKAAISAGDVDAGPA